MTALWLESAAQAFEPPVDDVFEKLGFEPNPGPQTRFLGLPDENLDVLYGGAAGGSKSTSLLMYVLRSCVRYPGLQVFWFRRTFPELQQSVLRMLVRYQYAAALGCKWNEGKYELRFDNGSILTFGHAKNEQEASALLSAEINLLIIDERTTLPPPVVDLLYSRVRSGVAGVPCLGVRSGTNPGHIGHAVVKAGYIDATRHGEIEITDTQGRRRIFIQARLSDTPQLGDEYRKALAGLPEKLRKAYSEGDWSTFEGQMFPELAWDRHVVAPFSIPQSWQRFAGVDWGYTAPWAVIWAALDEDGRVWLYRERYQTRVGETGQARQILAAEDGEHVGVRYADDAMWAVRGDALPIASVYASEGCYLTPAGKGPGSRVQGWQRVHTYLKDGPACPHHRAQGWDECPMMHVFTSCPNWYAEMESLPHATKGDPEDADTKAADHLCLAAGTLVATEHGPVPIERVTSGMRVWTRQGLRPVLAAGMTARNARTGSVLLSDGTVLRGTANHPVWVAGKGWISLDALRYSDIISKWPEAKASSSTASRSAVTRTRNSAPTASASCLADHTASVASGASTKRSGKPLTGRSCRVITSTTRTRTRSTTTRPTWNAFPALTTSRTISRAGISARPSDWPTWRQSGRLLRNGIAARKVTPGTASMASAPSVTGRWLRPPASSAGRSTRPILRGVPGSARAAVPRSGGSSRAWTTRIGCAQDAARRSRSTSMHGPSAAPVSVLGPFASDSAPRDVYNLTIDGAHEFYANGVLVHNCDATRYLLINLGGGPSFPILDDPAENPFDEIERLQPLSVRFAFRPQDDDPAADEDPRPDQGATQLSPFA